MPVGVLRAQGLRLLACALGALAFAAALAAQTKPAPAAASPAGTAQGKPAQTAPAPAGTAASKPPQSKPTDAAPKTHQATGTVASANAKGLVLIKQFGRNKVNWNFTLTPKTALDGKLVKAERVRVYYHEEKGQRVAERVRIVEAAPTAAVQSKNKAGTAPAAGARATSQIAPTTATAKGQAKPQSAP